MNGIKRLKNGTWQIDTKIKVNGEFRHFKKSGFVSCNDAKRKLKEEKDKFVQRREMDCSNLRFEDLIKEYKKMRKIVVNQSTLSCDESVYNVYLLPYFKGKDLCQVFRKDVIQKWYDNLVSSTKFTNNKKSKVITRTKDIFKFAYMHEYIGAKAYQSCDVILYQVKYSKQPKTERVIWSDDEFNDFMNATTINKIDNIMFRLFFACGTRIGEFLGLQPKCFDYRNRKIHIEQQVINVPDKGSILTDKLKTHESYRTILLTRDLAEDLHNYIVDMGLKDDDFMFYYTRRDEPISRNTFRRKLAYYCELSGARKINPHACRHMQATKLASKCKTASDIEICARRLGHSPEIFLNTYARHNNDEEQEKFLDA